MQRAIPWLLAVLAAISVAAILYLQRSSPPSAPPADPRASPAPAGSSLAVSSVPATPPPATPWPIATAPTASELGATVADRTDPQTALRGVEQVIYFYQKALGENPVGQNEDITAAILGDNPAHTTFLPPNSPAVKNGKLLDAWGTPYWFHPLSAKQMEIRSAGPDRELFTPDDLTLQ